MNHTGNCTKKSAFVFFAALFASTSVVFSTNVGFSKGGAKAHNNEFDTQFEALEWDVSRYECSVDGLAKFVAESPSLDLVLVPPLFNWEPNDGRTLPAEGVDFAGIRRYIENGGMIVVTEAQYDQVNEFFNKVDKRLVIRTGKCTSSPWEKLGFTTNENPMHPMRCFSNVISEADSWSHFVDPEKDGWTVLSRCSEGNSVVICKELGKGLVVYTALRQG